MPFSAAHAILIGVGSYIYAPNFDVPITAADADAVATLLRDPRYCGYPPEQVTMLAQATASRRGVLAALDALATRAGEGDTVLLFYAGHGEYGDDGYYLTTHDTRWANHRLVTGTGIRDAELIAKLRAIRAKRLLLIVNACHAGAISPVLAPGEEPLSGVPLPEGLSAALLGTGEGRVIISACREDQYSFIGPGPLTLFTQALVDGLQGKGVISNRGYISLFDLYTHLYFTLDELVPRKVPVDVRQRYGEKQEPELTILKGVGPFAVALYRGATALGNFDGSGSVPEGTALRPVNPARAQAMVSQYQQQIDIGDVAGGDTIKTGNISGTGIAIGPGASVRHVETGGGDYAEGNIDKRKGTFVSGDQYTMSGNFSGAILNIKSTLTNVAQSVGAAPIGDAATKAQLQQLLAQLSAELQQVPAAQAREAEAVAETAKAAVEQALKAQPNKTLVQINAESLKQAAQNIAAVLPIVVPIATQIADLVRKLMGA